jgi:hypothetical protein
LPSVTNREAVSLRALYLVPETATYGVRPCALKQALSHILTQQAPPKDITVFGPSFSGSVDSLLNAARAPLGILGTTPINQKAEASAKSSAAAVEATHASACVPAALGNAFVPCIITYSSSATVRNNDQIGEPIHYHTLAVADDVKMRALSKMAASLGVDSTNVAVIYEDTVFGVEVSAVASAAHFDRIPVPVNVADVRYGLADHQTKIQSKPPIDLAVLDQHLALDEGAENGSEFPIEESRLTPASSELALRAPPMSATDCFFLIVCARRCPACNWWISPPIGYCPIQTLFMPAEASLRLDRASSMDADKNQKTSAPMQGWEATRSPPRLQM